MALLSHKDLDQLNEGLAIVAKLHKHNNYSRVKTLYYLMMEIGMEEQQAESMLKLAERHIMLQNEV
jgi:hypothetical protein